jgi:hypothetical protein
VSYSRSGGAHRQHVFLRGRPWHHHWASIHKLTTIVV